MQQALQYTSIIMGIVAAVLWLVAAFATVPAGEPGTLVITTGESATGEPPQMAIDGLDLHRTMKRQACWNASAAVATALSLTLQLLALVTAH